MKPSESVSLLLLCILGTLGIAVVRNLSSDALAILATLVIVAPCSILALAIVVFGMSRRDRPDDRPKASPPQVYTPPLRHLPHRTHRQALPPPHRNRRVIVVHEPEPDCVDYEDDGPESDYYEGW